MLFRNIFNKNKIEKPVAEENLLEETPGVVSENAEDLGNRDPDFMGFGEGTIADLRDKIRVLEMNNRLNLINEHKTADEQRIQEIKDSII